ncbi:hypothetical protein FGO68_gene1994 [Halteria grandinella]|uniref:Uncharacterized protein n=1 Tax=Halteria grandinella TaxID=5974 RepID=A0A8J8T2M1_HALGN|nr:hypothetical protein FGO68_gene1994 [Halteria grandinella]
MSLYKQAQTTIYFKKLAEREEGNQSKENAPKIKQSRVARILSLKNDLVCIKDVANYHDANHSRKVSQKNRTLYAGGETEQPFNVLMKSNIKSLYQTPKALLLGAQNQLGGNMSKTGSKGNVHNASTDSLEGTAKGGSRKNLKAQNAFEGGLPPKGRFDKGQKLRGRNHVPPNNTFGVSREEREQVLSYKYFSPPTGAYYVKYRQVDIDDKIAKIVPEGSSPERDPRFDYSKKDTLLWLPHARELEGVKIANHNQFGVCNKCLKREGSIMGGSCDHSFYHTEHQQSAQKLVTQETLGNTLESTADGQNIHIQDGGIQQQLSTIKHAKFTTPGHSSPFNSSKFLNNPTGTGILNFATMTARKPITEGFLNPHDERFVLPKNQFPEILTKHRHSPKVNISGYAKRNAQKEFLTTAFTGLLHYQAEIPHYYPQQPGYIDQASTPVQASEQNPLIRELLTSAHKIARRANNSYNEVTPGKKE